ncbi:MAG: hypothetical protein IPG87_19495 [Saprospiraceae bacterium]|nr:hypothetical protein [Candidatus Vicinibacter affinis]
MRHIDNPSSANILPGDCIVATPTQRAALSIGPEDAGKVIVEKSTGRMYLATMTEGAKPLSANLAAELAAISAPVPLWVCGIPFVLFAGDGGSNGMLFTGTAGGFTLSAAVLTGFVIPVGYCYLPANAGGLGNAAGWFYFEMSSETAGIVYNNAFSPVVGTIPIVPGVKTPFANPVGGRITQTTADVTMLSYSLAAGAIGKNGSLRILVKRLASATATSKTIKLYADSSVIYISGTTSSSCLDFEAVIQNAGVINKQISTRAHTVISQATSSISSDLSSFDFSNPCTLSITANLAVNTDSVLSFLVS